MKEKIPSHRILRLARKLRRAARGDRAAPPRHRLLYLSRRRLPRGCPAARGLRQGISSRARQLRYVRRRNAGIAHARSRRGADIHLSRAPLRGQVLALPLSRQRHASAGRILRSSVTRTSDSSDICRRSVTASALCGFSIPAASPAPRGQTELRDNRHTARRRTPRRAAVACRAMTAASVSPQPMYVSSAVRYISMIFPSWHMPTRKYCFSLSAACYNKVTTGIAVERS